jgi:hypothetical protein
MRSIINFKQSVSSLKTAVFIVFEIQLLTRFQFNRAKRKRGIPVVQDKGGAMPDAREYASGRATASHPLSCWIIYGIFHPSSAPLFILGTEKRLQD